MRISTSSINQSVMNATSGNYQNYIDIINKIASNKNFTKMSQDVVGATKVLKMDEQIAKLNEYQSNIEAATSEMNLVYDTLGSVVEQITGINSLIVEASNASTTPESAKAIAEDVKQKVATIVSLMNTRYLDNYIFSGTNTQSQTYATNDDGTYTYQGTDAQNGDRNLTVSEGKTMAYNITADEIFKTTTTTVQDENGNDVEVKSNFFTEMNELNTLLNQEPLDYDAIRKKLDVIQDTQNSISMAQGTISARYTKLDTSKTLNEATLANLKIDKANIEEVDIAKAASELAAAQSALQASYSLSTTVLQGISLLDYI